MERYLVVNRYNKSEHYGLAETNLPKQEVQKIIDMVYMFEDYNTDDLKYLFGRCGIKYQPYDDFDDVVLF